MVRTSRVIGWIALLLLQCGSVARAEVLLVGPGQPFATPCAAFARAVDGDTIQIRAGDYPGDVCVITANRLTIRGVGGRAHVDAAGKSAGTKAIWVVQGADTLIEDVELSGCRVPDANGAGIRQEGRNLTVRRSYFHDNQNGILGNADPQSSYLIEDCEFADNGAGDGYSHNMYIGEIARFTLRGSYSHHAKVGHLVKSRARTNFILYNRLSDETGDASYELDLPQGGPSFVIGNVFQKSPSASNATFLSYARESARNPDSGLWVVNNTFVNARSAGTFVSVAAGIEPVVLRNNVFTGAGSVCDLASAVSEANFVGDPGYDDAANYDFQLAPGAAALDRGVSPGAASGESLTPSCQYVHPAHAELRNAAGTIDQGAFERDGGTGAPCSGAPTDAGTPLQSDAGRVDAAPPATSLDGSTAPRDAAPEVSAAANDAASGSDDPPRVQREPNCSCRAAGESHSRPTVLLGALWLALLYQRHTRRASAQRTSERALAHTSIPRSERANLASTA